MPGQTGSVFRARTAIACLAFFVSSIASAQIRFDLPAQSLSQTLTAIGSLANLNIIFDPTAVDGVQAPALKARLSAEDALTKLLAGTRLHVVRVDENTVRVVIDGPTKHAQAAAPPVSALYQGATVHLASARASDGPDAVTAAASSSTNASDEDARKRAPEALQEVLVTAEKRQERLQDVPVPVTAVNADDLVTQSQNRIQDYFSKVPGLNLELDGTTGVPNISIRGITTGGQNNPTVGITVDDVPYGSSTFIGGGFVSPDIDPSDLSRVEVLRGPQGTLYGVSSIGGLLKYVTVDPSTDALSGFVQAGLEDVHYGTQQGYNVRGALNVPLTDTLAFRASAFSRLDPGYVDNIQTGQNGINWGTADGGRLSALWRPLDNVSVKLSALLQHNLVNGSPLVDTDPGFGKFQQSFLRGTGGYEQHFEAYSANVTAHFHYFDLTSVTGYGMNTSTLSYDVSPEYGQYNLPVFGVYGSPYNNDLKTDKVSQELRLSGTAGEHLEWLAGGFFTHEKSSYISLVSAEAASGAIVGQSLFYSNPSTYQEYAGFADVTYHFTDQFDLQMGGRESEIRQTSSAVGSGFLNGGDTVTPEAGSSSNDFTYLLTPRLRLSSDMMIYARLASGYRAGGPNANALVNHVPAQYDPDKTQNYDLGVKGDLFDKTLSIDTALYYIDWKNVQVTVATPGGQAEYITNGGGAKSEGVEFSLIERPIGGLTLGAWVAWNEAVLTKDLPAASPAYGAVGDRLPYASRWSGNVSIDDEFSLPANVTGFVGGSANYQSERLGLFQSTAVRQEYPSYAKLDIHAGIKRDRWTVNLFVNNATDRRAPLQGGLDGPTTYANPESFIYLQPRTYGVSFMQKF